MMRQPAGEAPELEVLFDLTTVTHAAARSGGARVESKHFSWLRRTHPREVTAVSWSAAAGAIVRLDPEVAARYADADTPPVAAPPPGAPLVLPPVVAGRRRILLVTGTGWMSNTAHLHGLLAARAATGAELHVALHDLIPIRFPHWDARDDSARFGANIEAMVHGADRLLLSSDATARDLGRIVKQRRIRRPDCRPSRLGADTDLAAAGETGSPELRARVRQRPFVLYVSAISARKNHAFICDVWARLAERMGPAVPRLLLVGKVFPESEPLADRIARDPALRDRVALLQDVSDGDLAWLYRHCAFTVFPSLYEGWGLPVAEALSFGKVCLSSNAGSLPEVAGDATPVLDPRDFRAWVDAAHTLAFDPAALGAAEARVRERFRPRSWAQASADLWATIAEPLPGTSGDRDRERTHRTSRRATRRRAAGFDVAAREDWCVESGPGAAPSASARVGLALDDRPEFGIDLSVPTRNRASQPLAVELEINGRLVDGTVVPAGQAWSPRVGVPRDVLLSRGLLDVRVTARALRGNGVRLPARPLDWGCFAIAPLTPGEQEAALEARRRDCQLGMDHLFVAGSVSAAWLGRGWGAPAAWGTWTTQPIADLHLRPLPLPHEPIAVVATIRPFVQPHHRTQRVHVIAGGRDVAQWTFTHESDAGTVERTFVVPPEAVDDDGSLRVRFSMPDCQSPRALGMSDDERQLGIGLVKVHVCWAADRAR